MVTRCRAAGWSCLQVAEGNEPVWHLYVVRSPERDGLMRALADAGIGSQIHYPIPPHMQGAYADLGLAPEDFPLSRQLADEVFSLPMGPQVPGRGARCGARVLVARPCRRQCGARLVMADLGSLDGHRIRFRLVTPSDADYIQSLRTAPEYGRHLSAPAPSVAAQRAWIEAYKTREAEGLRILLRDRAT